LWTRALELAAEEDRNPLQSVRCQILDSTPGWFTDISSGFHFCWEMVRGRLGRALVVLLFPFVVLLSIALYLATLQWIPAFSRQRRWRLAWLRNLPPGIRHHLLLFSTDDKLIASSSVRDFAAQLRGMPTHPVVEQKEWARSVHVQHYKQYPDEYKAELEAFLSESLRR